MAKKHICYCEVCGNAFECKNAYGKYCADCKEKYGNNRTAIEKKLAAEGVRLGKGENVNAAVLAVCREVELYNQRHGTKYTYGQYVMLVKRKPKSKGGRN